MMTLEEAKRYLSKSKAKAVEIGVPMSVAVVDEVGNLVAFERMDGAGSLTVEIAQGKAFTAVCFGLGKGGEKRTSRYMGEILKKNGQQFFDTLNRFANGKLVVTPGGVPIVKDGKLIGGIGASGGLADEDELCASYGAS